MRFLLATRNKGKVRELKSVLEDLGIELISLVELGELPDAVEDGQTFAENARKKAYHYFHLTGLPTIADDSGLEVDLLGGRPGVHSARFAPTDAERVRKLLDWLSLAEAEDGRNQRGARFVCAICLLLSEKEMIEVEGDVRGEITRTPRGHSGFGYDPVFLYPRLGKTFGELPSAEKNRVSHRAMALMKLRHRLRETLKSS